MKFYICWSQKLELVMWSETVRGDSFGVLKSKESNWRIAVSLFNSRSLASLILHYIEADNCVVLYSVVVLDNLEFRIWVVSAEFTVMEAPGFVKEEE